MIRIHHDRGKMPLQLLAMVIMEMTKMELVVRKRCGCVVVVVVLGQLGRRLDRSVGGGLECAGRRLGVINDLEQGEIFSYFNCC